MNPPWEQFPTYERYTIGWRMGSGEQYLYDWRDFLETIPKDRGSRIEYLRSHRPAPLNWGDSVLRVLYPDGETDEEFGCSPTEINELLELGAIEHDAAYKTWRNQQVDLTLPWQLAVNENPEAVARYCMRDFWFFSRHLDENRSDHSFGEIPDTWASVRTQLETANLGEIAPENGLLTIAQMLCAGDVKPPWELGLHPRNFTDSFEMDMGYCDAFRLWIMSSFDDDKMIREILGASGIPHEWASWVDEQLVFS